MKKKLCVAAIMAVSASAAMAGGLLTNTNQNAVFLRNPARDAAIGIADYYSNPAGVAFLDKGFHLSLSWQAAFQKRQINSTAPFYQFNTANPSTERFFEGVTNAPVIPSFQVAYVFNEKWSVNAQFAVGGGGGACEFDNGLPMFEQMIGSKLWEAQATSYGLNQNLTGKQYFYGIQVGTSYKITDNLSVFGGARGVLANCSYVGAITNVTANGMAAGAYLTGVSQQAAAGAQQAAAAAAQFAAAGMNKEAAEYQAMAEKYQAAAVSAGQGAFLLGSDLTLDCSQSGFGITPILGVDWNLGKLNLAAKYEFKTKINMENDSKNSANVDAAFDAYKNGAKVRSDIPALLTVGAQYSLLDNLRLMGGFHYWWDKKAKGSATNVEKNTWEVTYGAEFDVNNWLTISAGGQTTRINQGEGLADTNFSTSSNTLALGATFRLSKMVNLNAGYMHTFYDDVQMSRGGGIVDTYTRKNDAVGVSVDLKF
ncbi:MAG: outer membrane beta-barrel protein [Bacteroidaceae bacterium]|nr:outer membrane beta-barrel protein [Bacteroidaceae bacterium]